MHTPWPWMPREQEEEEEEEVKEKLQEPRILLQIYHQAIAPDLQDHMMSFVGNSQP